MGGPGKPDYTRGDVQGEVKKIARPLTKNELMTECRKGRTEIVSKRGFTEPAKRYAKKYRPYVKLIDRE